MQITFIDRDNFPFVVKCKSHHTYLDILDICASIDERPFEHNDMGYALIDTNSFVIPHEIESDATYRLVSVQSAFVREIENRHTMKYNNYNDFINVDGCTVFRQKHHNLEDVKTLIKRAYAQNYYLAGDLFGDNKYITNISELSTEISYEFIQAPFPQQYTYIHKMLHKIHHDSEIKNLVTDRMLPYLVTAGMQMTSSHFKFLVESMYLVIDRSFIESAFNHYGILPVEILVYLDFELDEELSDYFEHRKLPYYWLVVNGFEEVAYKLERKEDLFDDFTFEYENLSSNLDWHEFCRMRPARIIGNGKKISISEYERYFIAFS